MLKTGGVWLIHFGALLGPVVFLILNAREEMAWFGLWVGPALNTSAASLSGASLLLGIASPFSERPYCSKKNEYIPFFWILRKGIYKEIRSWYRWSAG